MTDTPEATNNEISMQELVQGIGRLVIKLNESVVKVDKRIEDLEKNVSSLLSESFNAITAELSKTNELLAGMGGQMAVPVQVPEGKQATPAAGAAGIGADGLVGKLDELKAELSGMRKDLGNAEEKLLKALAEGPVDSVDRKMFADTLNDLSVMISESSKSLEQSFSKVIGESGESRDKVLADNIGILSEGIKDISERMEKAREGIKEKLEEIRSDTADGVAAIGETVKESTESQKEQLEGMKGLLSLHSVEVQDNRVRELNRSAIVHFNNAEYELAISDLKEALELSPESSELLANMAHIEASQGRLKEAEEHFRKALEQDPDLEPAISGLGTLMVISGRPGDTIDFLEKYLDEGSDSSTGVMIALSRAYAAQDNHAKALSLLERAEQAAPGHPELEQELAKYRK
ncbi:MAG: tetratricopeptide repeat protein [Candidatus Fermentibacteraceae bacterium]|nr:tetratricopeptide repeat protein [Candidatus Fermentibacteraceae bacterium]